MRHLIPLPILIALVIVPGRSSTEAKAEKSCREHPQLVGACFNVYGRLAFYNGNPSFRIWRIGTRRILGVSELRFGLEGYRNIPEELSNKVDDNHQLIGNYLVCPFTKQKPGEMQLVCIEKATNLVVKKVM